MDHIIDNLWLGSQRDADDLARNNPERITAILNVRGPDAYDPPGGDQSADHPGKTYKWIPAPDVEIVYPRQVREASDWLREQTQKGERILIHCKYGISRSPAFLAAFMVESGISANLDEAKTTIAARRQVHPAKQISEHEKPVVLVSTLTGLPNRHAFDQRSASSCVAAVDIDFMKVFSDSYGPMATDNLIRRLANILRSTDLDAYHVNGGEFLCREESPEKLTDKLSHSRQLFRTPFEVYAGGRIQSIEEADFSYGIGANGNEAEAALLKARKAGAPNTPEWLRKILGTGPGSGW